MEKRYKEIDGVRYQVIQNTILGSNVVPVGESLPEVTTSDNGKLLGVSSGEWTPVDAPSSLPDITGNAGKVLKVNAGATGTEWANETTELPAVTAADEGDVLTVNASGEWEAVAPGGGGLTLYGPYFAKNNSQASVGTTGESIDLDKIFDFDDNEVSRNNDAMYLMQSFNAAISGLNIQAVSPYSVYAKSLTGSSVTVGQFDCYVSFYSTIELQPVG